MLRIRPRSKPKKLSDLVFLGGALAFRRRRVGYILFYDLAPTLTIRNADFSVWKGGSPSWGLLGVLWAVWCFGAGATANAFVRKVMDFARAHGGLRSGAGRHRTSSMPECVGARATDVPGKWYFRPILFSWRGKSVPALHSCDGGGGAVCDSLAVFGKPRADHGGSGLFWACATAIFRFCRVCPAEPDAHAAGPGLLAG